VTARSVALFIVGAVAEIGGAYLMWQAIKEDRGLLFALAGAAALVGYGAVAALQPDAHFGRVLAAYGGVFIVGSLLWGMAFDGFRPDRYDIAGAAVCLIGVAVIMYSPRGAT
jgi:small multidrug resistance family-3 protein